MKATKKLKKVLLRGFNEMLERLWASEIMVLRCEHNRNEEDRVHWVNLRNFRQGAILNAIGDLIEVEGE